MSYSIDELYNIINNLQINHFIEEDDLYDIEGTEEFYKKVMSIKSYRNSIKQLKKLVKENSQKEDGFINVFGGNDIFNFMTKICDNLL